MIPEYKIKEKGSLPDSGAPPLSRRTGEDSQASTTFLINAIDASSTGSEVTRQPAVREGWS